MKSSSITKNKTTWQVGDVISQLYQVTEILEQDGYFDVYKVFHLNWKTELIIKSLKKPMCTDEALCEEFANRCRGWIRLGLHPNVTGCHYLVNLDGCPSLLVDYVEGQTLEDWMMHRKVLSWKRILDISIQCLDGLSFAHKKNQIHRDLKPSSCFVTPSNQLKIKDFQIASALEAMGNKARNFYQVQDDTSLGIFPQGMAGTAAYMAPEVWKGDRESIGPWTDIYSFGAMLFELCSGRRPFRGGTIEELGQMHQEKTPPKPRTYSPDIPMELSDFIFKCLEKEPKNRFENCDAAREKLVEIFEKQTGAEYRRRKPDEDKLMVDGLNNLAVSLLDLGEYEKAGECWEMALKNNPAHPQSVFNFGIFRLRTGQVDETTLIEQMSEIVRINPGQWFPVYLLGLMQMELDDYDGAVQTLMQIIGSESIPQHVGEILSLAQDMRVSSMRLLQTIHSVDPVRFDSVNISHDGKMILSGAEVLRTSLHAILIWEESTGKRLKTLRPHDDQILSVCFSPNDKYILSGSADKTVKLWDAASSRCLRTFEGHTGKVRHVCFNDDGEMALSTSSDKTVRVWEISTGKCLQVLEGHQDQVTSAAFVQGKNRILSTSKDKTLKMWDAKTGKCLETFQGHTHTVTDVISHPESNLALSGSLDGTLRLWDMNTGLGKGSLENHHSGVTTVDFSRDGNLAISGAQDGIIKLWDAKTGNCMHSYRGQKGHLLKVGIRSERWFAFSRRSEDTCELWQLSSDIVPFRAPLVLSRVSNELVSESPDARTVRDALDRAQKAISEGDILYAAEIISRTREEEDLNKNEELLRFWSSLYKFLPRIGISDVWETNSLEGHTGQVLDLSIGKDCRTVLSGSADRTMRMWDIESGRCLQVFKGHSKEVNSVFLGNNGLYALSGSADCTIKLWDLASGSCRKTYEGHTDSVSCVLMTSDGRYLISGSGGTDSTIRLWESSTGRCLRTLSGQGSTVNSLSLSIDGRYLLSGGSNKSLILWDLAEGKVLRSFHGHEGPVLKVFLSRDGRFAFSGSGDALDRRKDRVIQWDVTIGKSRRVFSGHQGGISALDLTGDNRFLFTGGGDKQIHGWDTTTGRKLLSLQAHDLKVTAIALSKDTRYFISSSLDKKVKIWYVDWKLAGEIPQDLWDEGARPFLDAFLTLHTPYGGELPPDSYPSEDQITQALGRRGEPLWSLEDFEELMNNLACAGYGWLQPGIIRRKLFQLQRNRKRKAPKKKTIGSLGQKLKKPIRPAISEKQGLSPLAASPVKAEKSGIGKDMPGPTVPPMRVPKPAKGLFHIRSIDKSAPQQIEEQIEKVAPRREKLKTETTPSAVKESVKPEPAPVFPEKPLKAEKKKSKPEPEPKPNVEKKPEPEQALPIRRDMAMPPLHAALPTNLLVDERLQQLDSPFFNQEHLSVKIDPEVLPLKGGKHETSLRSASISPNGHYGITCGNDHFALLWNLPDGVMLRKLDGHEDIVYCSAFSPDGALVATGSGDKTINIWNTNSGQCQTTLDNHKKGVFSICFTRDGRFLISGSEDRTIRLWEVKTGRSIRTFTGHFGWVQSVAVSHDDRFIISASQDRTIKIWDISTGECLSTLKGHTGVIRSVDVSPDFKILSGSRDGTIRLWNPVTGACLKTYTGHKKSINTVSFLCDSSFMITGAGEFFEEGSMKLWQVDNGKCLDTVKEKSGVISVSASADGQKVLWVTAEPSLNLRSMNWELRPRDQEPWDDDAHCYVDNFLSVHGIPLGELPAKGRPDEESAINALKKSSETSWEEEDLENLIYQIKSAGFGYVESDGIKKQVKLASKHWNGPLEIIISE